MKLLHTADWHLGRIFNNHPLTEDQAEMLEQLLAYIERHKPDALLIAGDIYDRSVPPENAVALLDSFLTKVLKHHKTKIFIIAGNHDGAKRLGFGSKMFAEAGLYIAGQLSPTPVQIFLEDEHGPVCFYPLPYASPTEARNLLGNPEIATHQDALQASIDAIWKIHPAGVRSVVLAHAFVAGGEESESERLLTVGGSAVVNASCFQGFDYVALGHLHRPQTAGAPHIRYSGSLMKYSFSEIHHEKSASLATLDENGLAEIRLLPLKPSKETRHIEGTLKEVLAQGKTDPHAEDYVRIKLLDEGALLDPIGALRKVYPNLLELQRNWNAVTKSQIAHQGDYQTESPLNIFRSFFEQVEETPLNESQEKAFLRVVEPLLAQQKAEED